MTDPRSLSERSETKRDEKEMALRYAGTCSLCGVGIDRGVRAVYQRSTRTVRHITCEAAPAAIDHGTAGGSAQREYERRKVNDAARIAADRAAVHERFGDGFVGKVAAFLAVDDRPRRSTEVWAQGAVGEEAVAARLDELAEAGVVALHDRRVPRTRANIDHIAISPWGVWVVDAKRYLQKRPDFVVEGSFLGFGGTRRLTVGGRRKDNLVEGVLRQMALVKEIVGEDVPVGGVLAFVDADWPLIGGTFTVRGVEVVWPRRLAKVLLRTDPPTVDVDALSRELAAAFPPA